MAASTLRPAELDALARRVRGGIVRPDDPDYDHARRIWNGMIDRRPAVIARCTGVADVTAAIRFGREHDLPIAVRGGGHNVAGNSVCDGGIVVDLAPMRHVRVDPARAVARVAGGARLGDVDHETQAFGLAAPVGAVSETGLAGLALHGGFGFLTRKHGLTADNLVAADVVTADGTAIAATPDHHPELLWALKGGGGGFGVVTSFELRLHPVGPDVYVVLVFYPAAAAAQVLDRFRAIMPEAPDDLMALALLWSAPEDEGIPEPHRGAPVIAVAGVWSGPVDRGDAATRPLRRITTPLADLGGPMPYVEAQRLFDPDYPRGRRYYWKSLHLDTLTDELIGLACDAGAERPTPLSTVEVWGLGGAMARVPPDATPYHQRAAPFLLTVEANAIDPATDDAIVAWARRWHDRAARLTTGGAYLNFGGFWEGGDELLARAFGPNLPRLRRVKATYDPDDVFRHAIRVRPDR